ncbi:MAG: ClpXP protease specificity-enhancing factor [Alysiella sp.]|uniref:ClpXP protease specificity-enhancing factor n=1 Tax=Alysiella sp. TaxID=1872483 RepID=UPI0026DBF154|nr:ClpXP protease specificity-enhancing factor [Alysiella sp.]MDO4433332.1 ClpXP protease specificity-enhancing factor [Alysiella sp.]
MSLSTKPYFVRALYEWCADNGYTPFLAVWVNEHTRVPRQFVQDNQIVLNIGMNAVKDLVMDNEWITFSARFGGVAQDVMIPIGHVVGLFARETGEGMGFEAEEWLPENVKSETPAVDTTIKMASHEEKPVVKKGLKLVK